MGGQAKSRKQMYVPLWNQMCGLDNLGMKWTTRPNLSVDLFFQINTPVEVGVVGGKFLIG